MFGLMMSLTAIANSEEPVWKQKARSVLVKLVGTEKSNQILGQGPVVSEEAESLKMPTLPLLEKKNTDSSVYRMDSELRAQGKEFESLSLEKRRSYEIAYIKELFQATRRAPAKEDDLAKWINVLEGGGSREGVYRGVVLDDVYASLENYEEPLSEKILPWTISFSRKYLALAFKESVLKQGNLFFLKRVISEKVFEMLDALESKPDDFRVWYAIYSAELAKDFPQLWKDGIRSDKRSETHYKWAKKAHIQHIKSETVIKLHIVMNSLQDAQ